MPAVDVLYVENLELSGATVAGHNGAGIRHEGGDLIVINSRLAGNENGILAAGRPGGRRDPYRRVRV